MVLADNATGNAMDPADEARLAAKGVHAYKYAEGRLSCQIVGSGTERGIAVTNPLLNALPKIPPVCFIDLSSLHFQKQLRIWICRFDFHCPASFPGAMLLARAALHTRSSCQSFSPVFWLVKDTFPPTYHTLLLEAQKSDRPIFRKRAGVR